jgi:hypothetical protein
MNTAELGIQQRTTAKLLEIGKRKQSRAAKNKVKHDFLNNTQFK